MKSASYQGASVFYGFGNFVTCPVHALAVATIMQTSPSQFLLDHLPRDSQSVEPSSMSGRSLLKLLERRGDDSQDDGLTYTNNKTKITVPGIQAYVNRLLHKWSGECITSGFEVKNGLSSHSFRRGAAQNANSNCNASTPWILDRGGWSMASISKAFNYIVSTTQEDQQVGKILAGWGSESEPCLPSLQVFEPAVMHNVRQLQKALFACSSGFGESLDLRNDALEVLMAVAILHYHDMLDLEPKGPYITRVKATLDRLCITESELASWTITIHTDLVKRRKRQPSPTPAATPTVNDLIEKQSTLIKQQLEAIDSLSYQVSELKQRVASLDRPTARASYPTSEKRAPDSTANTSVSASTPRSRSRAKSLSVVWFEWFCNLAWLNKHNRRRYHDAKVAVAFMHIFLPEGYDATGTDNKEKARILKAGQDAEERILTFLKANYEKTKAYGTVVKTLKRMYAKGKLNEHIVQYQACCAEGLVVDDSPGSTVHVLTPQHAQETE